MPGAADEYNQSLRRFEFQLAGAIRVKVAVQKIRLKRAKIFDPNTRPVLAAV
jgi:hypothetical protein